MKTLAIIGSTGSIGNAGLKVYKKNQTKFKLLYLAANTNYKKLKIQSLQYKPQNIFLLSNPKKKINNKKLIDIKKFLNLKKKIDFIISGTSGFESININFKLLKICKNLLIANKETIICGGSIFINEAKKYKCNLIPIDSEHHCIDFFLKNLKTKNILKKIYITASGGPFLNKNYSYKESIKSVLKHPNWKMGKKITVDSSTYANKVLELFEAKKLFSLKSSQIDFKVEERSNVHAIIQLKNNINFFLLHKPTMEITISNALQVPNNFLLDLNNLKINMLKPNINKFPLIKLGNKIMRAYNDSGAIFFTVFNERLVNMYLKNKINYGDISKFLVKVFSNKKIITKSKSKMKSLKQILNTINYANNYKLC